MVATSESTEEKLDPQDVEQVLEALSAFIRKSIAPVTARPECAPKSEQLEVIFAEAIDLGLISPEEPSGLGLWESVEDDAAVALSKAMLAAVAEESAGIAFHFHSLALGWHLCRRLDLPSDQTTVALLQGNNGLAQGALANLLGGRDLNDRERLLLQEYFPAHTAAGPPTVLQASSGWKRVLVPSFDQQTDRVEWALYDRQQLNVSGVMASHGLDETTTWHVSIAPGAKPIATPDLAAGDGILTLLEGIGINALAMMAIGLGSVRTALAKAEDYAALRKQGGKTIGQHPAVRLLLGQVAANAATVGALVDQVQAVPHSLDELEHILRFRAVAHPLLCQAATDALQVFGGYGYMRDYGLEKILRDNQHLRLSFGTPKDILLQLGTQEER